MSDCEDESVEQPSVAAQKSLQGNALRNLRKQMDFSMTMGKTLLSGTLNQPKEPEIPKTTSNELLSLDQGFIFAKLRLFQIKFENSKTQPKTRADGNCFLYACLDQIKYDDVLCHLFDGPKDHFDFRYLVVNSLEENIENGHIVWDERRQDYDGQR